MFLENGQNQTIIVSLVHFVTIFQGKRVFLYQNPVNI